MSKTLSYNNFSEVTTLLQKAGCEYLILRNFDELLSDDVFMAGHADIDVLCRNAAHLANSIGASPARPENPDGVHFRITVNDKKASLDLRQIGDGYYCTAWQEEMLKTRVHYNGFYIMDQENLFYSLTYHAILQKHSLSEEYKRRLIEMGKYAGIEIAEENAEKQLLAALESFMAEKGYTYTYCTDKHVPLRKSAGINPQLIEKNPALARRHFFYDTKLKIIDTLVRTKHKIIG